jgi:diamine N-acetyltransferase
LPEQARPPPFRLVDVDGVHFEALTALAARIWREHYTPIIGGAQVEHMLRSRYTAERLGAYVGSSERWLKLLFVGNALVAYCSYALDGAAGMKLEQLYVEAAARGKGLGRALVDHVEGAARAHRCARVWLTVNRRNAGAIAVYERHGFAVERAAVFDIGDGFVMDDYVMTKAV